MSTQEELDFIIDTALLEKAFLDSKLNKENDYQAYREAKAAWSAHRTYWRQIREWFQAVAAEENN